ncbi:peptidase M28-like protein [Hymenobacter chitinivorans DSM 11115]|uniref:Peptidase M28-like protein n=1 Tax=Hymenobacter chitinivorans DSM 11115 TaxID=1121954 RepID=A0A2M9ASH8_9BACT|nr:peptidase M28-like protein [Hymenobacter chitinivorans DSM 11115]
MAGPAAAQPSAPAAKSAPSPALPYSALITPALLRQHLTELASDAYEGRETGRPGQAKAAQYLARQFEQLGLRGPVSGGVSAFQQPFGLVSTTPTAQEKIRVGATQFVHLRDFVRFGPSMFVQSPAPADPVFMGYGIETDTYSDYASGPDVRGRDVIVLDGEPTDAFGSSFLSTTPLTGEWASPFRKAALARDKGARSILVVTGAKPTELYAYAQPLAAALAEPTYSLTAPVPQPAELQQLMEEPPAGISCFITTAQVGVALLHTTPALLRRYRQDCYRLRKPAPASFQPPAVTVELPQKREELTSTNVLGFLEGTDKKDEILVVSAHYDHVGVQHDTIYNGADDDGSGTSAVLALARAFTQATADGHGPRRSILFLLNSGEEKGLLGSEYYAGHPVFPLSQTIADLNIDMVGRTDKVHQGKPDYLYLIGSNRLSTELHTLSEATNAQYSHLGLDYTYNDPNDPEQLYYRSDHYNFARHRIPIIFYTSGLHADYHKATDDVDKIEFDRLAERTQLVFFTAWELANREKRPSLNATRP